MVPQVLVNMTTTCTVPQKARDYFLLGDYQLLITNHFPLDWLDDF